MLHLRTTTTAAALTTTTKKSFLIYLRAIHNITRLTHIQKKLLLEGNTHLEAVRKDKNILQTVPAIVKCNLLCVKLFKLQNKFGQKYKLHLLIPFLTIHLLDFYRHFLLNHEVRA